jgi:predicted DNA-binding transcriptional regulator AlpA
VTTGPESGGPGDRLLPWGKVKDITGLSRTTAWRRQKVGDFPLAVVISPGRVGWWESEVNRWKVSRSHRAAGPVVPPNGSSRSASRPPAPVRSPETAVVPVVSVAADRASTPALPPRARSRRSSTCEGQIAFEF